MSAWESRTFVEDVLARGVDDWVYAAEVLGVVERSGVTDRSQLRQLALGVISEVLVGGFAVAGEVDGERHRPWECSVGDAIARIVEEWGQWGDEAPTPGAVVWLDATLSGVAVGQAVLDREESELS